MLTFPFKKKHLKVSSAKWRPCSFVLNVWKNLSLMSEQWWKTKQNKKKNMACTSIYFSMPRTSIILDSERGSSWECCMLQSGWENCLLYSYYIWSYITATWIKSYSVSLTGSHQIYLIFKKKTTWSLGCFLKKSSPNDLKDGAVWW